MLQWEFKRTDTTDGEVITYQFNTYQLDTVISYFNSFLNGCGYILPDKED